MPIIPLDKKMRLTIRTIMIIVSVGYLLSCLSGTPTEYILSDFEADRDLDRFDWKCHTLFSLSTENVTHGNTSLKLDLYPSDYPGLSFKLDMNNWSAYRVLSVDIYNPENEEVSITVRIDDKKDCPDFDDRYNKSFNIKSGSNGLRIPLDSLITSDGNRTLDLKKIYGFLIFMSHPQKKRVLYVDYVHLN